MSYAHLNDAMRLSEQPEGIQPRLTRRERQLLATILQGRTNREIGALFGTTERTIKNQLSTLYQKLHVKNRLQLAVYAMRHTLDRE